MIIEDFTQIYQRLNKDNLELLTDLYSADITFIDPLHTIEGIDNLTVYFAGLYDNVSSISFDFEEVISDKTVIS
jgi:ketosteroid isomerase-like protein